MATMDKEKLAIIMLGPPGAGKGTQARKISDALVLPHISTGDMLREALKNETELGKKARTYLDSGALVPDELVDAIVAERLSREDCSRGFILDGYPRTIPQAQFLGSLVQKDGSRPVTLGMEVDEDVLIKRLSSRWTCPKCGKIFNADLDPGKVGGRCDECSAALVQRRDDTAEVIVERLQVYKRATQPLVQYYQEQGSYVAVKGEGSVERIFDSVMKTIKDVQRSGV
jgi:adenylate kinase